MKRLFIVFILALSGLAAGAQKKPTTSTTPVPVKKVYTATPSSFETSIVQGKLTMTKTFNQSAEGAQFTTNYAIINTTSRGTDNKKAVSVSLNRESFEMIFTRGTTDMTEKLPKLNKYISDKNISLTEEKGWIAVIDYYNNLP